MLIKFTVSGHIVSVRLCNKPSVPGVQGNSTDESGFVNKSLPDLGNVNALFHTAHKHQVDDKHVDIQV